MISISFVVDSKPPYKQNSAGASERDNQKRYGEALKEKAKEVFNNPILTAKCSISVRYCRYEGMMDGANIIGGILDKLQGIIFKDDRQIT